MSQHDELIERLRRLLKWGAKEELFRDAPPETFYQISGEDLTDIISLLSAPSVAPQKDAGDDMTTAASVTITAPVVECLPASEGREFLQDAIRELDKSGRVTRDYIERAEAFLSALGGDMSNESEPLRLSIEKVKAALPVAPTTDKKE